MITSKQRAYLRGMANRFPAIMQIGKDGLTDNLVKTCSDALEARELIKLHILENNGEDPRAVAEELARATGSELVAVTGKKAIFYRRSSKKSVIELPS